MFATVDLTSTCLALRMDVTSNTTSYLIFQLPITFLIPLQRQQDQLRNNNKQQQEDYPPSIHHTRTKQDEPMKVPNYSYCHSNTKKTLKRLLLSTIQQNSISQNKVMYNKNLILTQMPLLQRHQDSILVTVSTTANKSAVPEAAPGITISIPKPKTTQLSKYTQICSTSLLQAVKNFYLNYSYQ